MTGKAAVAVARRRTLRRATVKAAKPPAKVGWRVGKYIAARKARRHVGRAREQMDKAREQMERVGAAGKTLGSFVVIYGPMAAEVFGLIETPKPKRRAPAFAAGLVVGAGALYALNRKNSN